MSECIEFIRKKETKNNEGMKKKVNSEGEKENNEWKKEKIEKGKM